MEKFIFKTKSQMGAAAAASAAQVIKQAIKVKKQANMILATGTSQFEMLKNLAAADEIDWQEVTMFHLDEYIGLSADHPASFRRFLKERFVDKVPGLKAVHFVNGDAKDPQQECRRISAIIAKHPIDVAFWASGKMGIWRLMTRQRISQPSSPTLSWSWTKNAEGNSWAKAGSRR